MREPFARHGTEGGDAPSRLKRQLWRIHGCATGNTAGADRTRRAFHVQQPLPVDMFGITRNIAVRRFQQQRRQLTPAEMRPHLTQQGGRGGDKRRRHAGAGHCRVTAAGIGRGDIDTRRQKEAVADLRRVEAGAIPPGGADISRPVAGDAPGGGIPVADNEHLPVQQKHPVIACRRRHLVRASAVVGAAVTGGLHQDLVRAKRLAPGGGLAAHAVKPVHPIVRIVEIVASLFKLDEAPFKPVVAQIGGADIHRHRPEVTPPGPCRSRQAEIITPASGHLCHGKLRIEGAAMHADTIAPCGDNAGDMRSVPMRIGDAGTGIVAGMRQRGRQIGMRGIDTGIGNGHKAAKPGPAARIGLAEIGNGKRRRRAPAMIFTALIVGRIRERPRRRCAISRFLPVDSRCRVTHPGPRRIAEAPCPVIEHNGSGGGKTTATATAAGGHQKTKPEKATGSRAWTAAGETRLGDHGGRTELIETVRRVALDARESKKSVKF